MREWLRMCIADAEWVGKDAKDRAGFKVGDAPQPHHHSAITVSIGWIVCLYAIVAIKGAT
jgi:hypothetical protein